MNRQKRLMERTTTKYKIVEVEKGNAALRNEFFNLISAVFPAVDFREWHEKGFWTNRYFPYSLSANGKLISNVSAALMNVIIKGKKYKAIQLGAVATLPEYRNRGLSRELMNYVIEKWEDRVDFFFLFANEKVLNFYPKFGFKEVKENLFVAEERITYTKSPARKLILDDEHDYSLLLNLINHRLHLTKIFGAEDYGFITMWHILNIYYNDVYYLEEKNIVFIKKIEGDTLHIRDMIFTKTVNFDLILPKIIGSGKIKKIFFYFPPDQLKYSYDKKIQSDSFLYVRGEINLNEEFLKFPETAQT